MKVYCALCLRCFAVTLVIAKDFVIIILWCGPKKI